MTLVNPTFLVNAAFGPIDISAGLNPIYEYTALVPGEVAIDIWATVAGGGDYSLWGTKQWAGAGTHHTYLPKATVTPPSTDLAGLSISTFLFTGDVLRIYLQGLSGDTAVSGGIRIAKVNWSVLEQADILSDATPFDGANIDAAISTLSTFDPTTDNVIVGGHTVPALAEFVNTDTLEVAAVAGSVAELSQCNAAGFPAGSIEYTLTIESPGGIPIAGASVWISTDVGMTNIIWRGVTDTFGTARDVNNQKPWLDAGLYQFWVQDDNWTDSNPTPMVVS